MQHVVKHRSASGDLEQGWVYDHVERRIYVALKRGSRFVEFYVFVCDGERPRLAAHPIVRRSADAWAVLQLRFWRTWRQGRELLDAIKCPISDELEIGDSLVLTNTPREVSAQLEAL